MSPKNIKENLLCLISELARGIYIVNQTKWKCFLRHKSQENSLEEKFIGGWKNRRRPLNTAEVHTRKHYLIHKFVSDDLLPSPIGSHVIRILCAVCCLQFSSHNVLELFIM